MIEPSLCRSDSQDASLETKLKATKADTKVEHDWHEEVTLEGRDFFSLGLRESFTNFIKSFDEV